MKRFTIIASLIFFIFYSYCKLFGNCCWVDYTSNIKNISEPLQHLLAKFISVNKRAPNPKEKEIILKELGCKNIRIYYEGQEIYCSYKGQEIYFELDDVFIGKSNPLHAYGMRVSISESSCYADLDIDLKNSKRNFCYNKGCLQWQH